MANVRIKTLFIIPSLVGGGAERVIIHIVRHLDRTKFEPLLAVLNTQSAAYLHDIPADIELIDLKCPRVRYAFFKLIRLIWSLKPTVVFSTLGHLNLFIAIIKPLLPQNIRFLCRETIVLSEALNARNCNVLWRWAYKYYYNRFDKIICQSLDMRDDLQDNFGLKHHKLSIINNPVDIVNIRRLAAEPIPSDLSVYETIGLRTGGTINLVSAGRLVYQKGFDLLINALALNANPAMHLTLLGEGDLKEDLYELAKNLGLEQQIHFVGFQKNPYAFIARADAFVLSSRYEGFPNVVIESLTCGTPVIATPAKGGIKEILEDMEGCLIADSVSTEGLAHALSNFAFGKRLPANVVETYAVERIVKQYQQQFIQ